MEVLGLGSIQVCFKHLVGDGVVANMPGGTDFGYLTILTMDQPGLQVLSPSDKWVDVPFIENSYVVNGKSPNTPHSPFMTHTTNTPSKSATCSTNSPTASTNHARTAS